jgi:glycosyltransferase involved in cell wall biosynthesis
LGVSGCAILPIFRLFSKKKLIINIDGLEHRRDKWNKWVRKFLKFSEAQAVKYGDFIVTDNKGITDYVKAEYGHDSELIAYGGDHVIQDVSEEEQQNILNKYNITSDGYSMAICRIEPENNVHLILEAYEKAQKPLVFIGNWQKSEYGRQLAEKYSNSKFVRITPAVYDLKVLNVLRSNCSIYLHGHSAGGTNPSLVEAMFFQKPIYAFDCVYNRESTENKAFYFKSVDDLVQLISDATLDNARNAVDMFDIANQRYRWEIIAKQYESLY